MEIELDPFKVSPNDICICLCMCMVIIFSESVTSYISASRHVTWVWSTDPGVAVSLLDEMCCCYYYWKTL